MKFSPKGEALWAAVPDGGASVRFESVVVDSSGNAYVAGELGGEGTAAFGGGVLLSGQGSVPGPVLVKYAPNGTVQWARAAVGSGGSCDIQSLAIDAAGNLYAAGTLDGAESCDYGNGVIVTGSSPINPVLVKYGPTGRALWARTTVGGSSKWYARSVALDGMFIYLALEVMEGDSSEYHDFGNGVGLKGGYVIVGYDPDGAPQWAARPPCGTAPYNPLIADGAGHVYLMGYADPRGTIDFGNGRDSHESAELHRQVPLPRGCFRDMYRFAK